MFILRLPLLLLHIVYSLRFFSRRCCVLWTRKRKDELLRNGGSWKLKNLIPGNLTTPFYRYENRMQVHYIDVKRQSASTTEMQSQTEAQQISPNRTLPARSFGNIFHSLSAIFFAHFEREPVAVRPSVCISPRTPFERKQKLSAMQCDKTVLN